jgi:nicotinate-nucleotide adenylyltransferase
MRLGIYGGSFDPVHYGHLLLAESCREQCALDEVWLLPAAVPPHKTDQTLTSARQRIEMLNLAIGGHDAFRISTIEIDRGGVSYTVDTLTGIRQQHPHAELFLLMGADTLHDLPNWRQPERVCELAVPVVVQRNGSPAPDLDVLQPIVTAARIAHIQQHQVTMPIIALTSTDIRRRVAAGMSIRFRTPRAVEKYIESNRLYADSL